MIRTFSAVLAVCAAAASHAGVNNWTPTGPDGGSVLAVAYHPTTPGLVFAVADKTVYRSEDGGQTWGSVLDGNAFQLSRIVIDGGDPNRLLAGGFNVLYLSSNAGETFSLVTSPGLLRHLEAAADSSVVYAIESLSEARVFRSEDFGASWEERLANGLPAGLVMDDFVIDPADVNTLYAIFDADGLYRSTDGGENWTPQSAFTVALGEPVVAVDPADSTRLLLATINAGVMSSSDGGATWATEPVAGRFAWVGYHPAATNGEAIAVSLNGATVRRPGHEMAWSSGQSLKFRNISDGEFDPSGADTFNVRLLLATDEGPLLTTDGGVSYSVLSQGIRSATVTDIEPAPDGSDRLFVAFSSGSIGLHQRSLGEWSPVGNDSLRAALADPVSDASVTVAPNDTDRLFFASGLSVVNSVDGGDSWSGAHPEFSLNFLYSRAIAFAPSDAQTIYVSTDSGGVYRSQNQGVTWQPPIAGVPAAVDPIAVDPMNADIVYAGTRPPETTLLFKTTDGGENWLPSDTGMSGDLVSEVVVNPADPSTVYAVSSGTGSGLYISEDSGQTWTRADVPAAGFSVAVDPIVSTNIVASDINDDVLRSVDGGATWEALPLGRAGSLVDIVELDPANPHIVLAGATNYGLIEFEVSTDIAVGFLSVPSSVVLDGSDVVSVQVANNGPYAASAVTLRLELPPGLSASSAETAQGSCGIVGSVITCQIGAMQVGAFVETDIGIVGGGVPSSGILTASTEAHEAELNETDNSVSGTIDSIRTADLSATLTSASATIDNGETTTLTARVSNPGPNDTTSSELVIVLDGNLTLVSAGATSGTCAESGGTVSCDLAAIASGSDATVTLDVMAAAPGTLTATATVGDLAATDTELANNSALLAIEVQPVTDLSISLTGEPAQAVAGRTLEYSFDVSNAGPDELEFAVVRVAFSGATLNDVSAGESVVGCFGSVVTSFSCTIGSLASESSEVLTVSLTAATPGDVSVSVSVSFAGTDTSPGNDAVSITTSVAAAPVSGGGGGGGGGGGAQGLLELLLTLVILGLRRRRSDP